MPNQDIDARKDIEENEKACNALDVKYVLTALTVNAVLTALTK